MLAAILALLLLAAPALQAAERGVSPSSPYRLAGSTERGSPLPDATASYRFDQRYRLAPVVAEALRDKPYVRQIDAAARGAGLDPALVHALVAVESAYQPSAVSPKGAVGLMQLLPATALRYGVSDPARVDDNLRAGTRHLRDLMDRFDNRLDLALAAYNAGEAAVSRYHNSVPPYAETRQYVPAVIGRYRLASKAREYLPGTRLDSTVRFRLPDAD